MKAPPRARRITDASRMTSLASRPGIDPRVWLCLGRVVELGWDPVVVEGVSGGLFADVKILPEGDIETCFVGMPYAGDGYGAWFPPEVGELVVVAVPMGDTGSGPTIISRMWRGEGQLPPTATDLDWAAGASGQDPPGDIWIRAKEGRSIKIRGNGADIDIRVETSGDVVIENLGSGKVKLGLAETAQPVALSPLVETAISTAVTAAIIDHTHTSAAPGSPTGPGVLASPVIVPTTAAIKTEAT